MREQWHVRILRESNIIENSSLCEKSGTPECKVAEKALKLQLDSRKVAHEHCESVKMISYSRREAYVTAKGVKKKRKYKHICR